MAITSRNLAKILFKHDFRQPVPPALIAEAAESRLAFVYATSAEHVHVVGALSGSF